METLVAFVVVPCARLQRTTRPIRAVKLWWTNKEMNHEKLETGLYPSAGVRACASGRRAGIRRPPVVKIGSYDIDFSTSLCPGIDVRDREIYTEVVTFYYADAGDLLRVSVRYSGTDNFYNAANPDVVLSGVFNSTIQCDARTGECYSVGAGWHITVPGYGTVLVRAGRFYNTGPDGWVLIGGKDSFLSPQDMQQFCSYLAGD